MRWIAAVAIGSILAFAAPAGAQWPASGSGPAASAAALMPTGPTPTASASGSQVTVTWSAVDLSNGSAVAGYTVLRFNAVNGTQATVGAGCAEVVSATSCTEQAVPAGSWVYATVPVMNNWSGPQGPPSGSVTTN